MIPRRIAAWLFIPFLFASALASDTAKHLTKEERIEIIRGLNAERVFARVLFPMGKTELTLKNGSIVAPKEGELRQLLADNGPAAKPGDRALITNVEFRGNGIRFEINGGPRKRQKWYQRVQVGGMGGTVPLSQGDTTNNPHGSYVDLQFEKFIPSLTPTQVKQMLAPVLDFNAQSAAEAYLKTLPPKVSNAIKDHKVLVGMDREMVSMAKGRAPKKVRERDGNVEYEEWIYGAPPQEVEFVRLVGDEVVRVETMKVDGEKIVRTAKEVEIKKPEAVAQSQEPQPRPANAPTLRRPGEQPTDAQPAGGIAPLPRPAPGDTPTSAPTPGSDPTKPQ